MPRMTRLGLLTAILTISSVSFSGCSAPFIGNVNFTLGSDNNDISEEVTKIHTNCPAYKPMPDSLKAFAAKQNDTDPAINPWAGWLLNLRQWLEGGCQ